MKRNFHTKDQMHIPHVTLRIKDEGKMLNFYLNVLKMKLISQEQATFHLGTKEGHKLVTLIVDPHAFTLKKTIGLYHYALLLPTRKDLALFTAHYLKTQEVFVGASDHHVSEAVYLEDPEGNGIEIYVDKDCTTWTDNEGDIFMHTIRLDLEELFSLLNDDKYDEMPVGTIMGHLHLHVANIEKAHTFFVDTIGFQKILGYKGSAEFTSDGNYHHHLAFNVWRKNAVPEGVINTGLVSYQLHLPMKQKSAFIKRLNTLVIDYTIAGNKIIFIDINGVTIVAVAA